MHPVQHFKANFSQLAEDGFATTTHGGVLPVGLQLHEADSFVRNICFVWDDGRKSFFNYAYLVSVDLDIDDNTNVMRLHFSSHVVSLKGYNLELLFNLLVSHKVKSITAVSLRYVLEEYKQVIIVIDIRVKNE